MSSGGDNGMGGPGDWLGPLAASPSWGEPRSALSPSQVGLLYGTRFAELALPALHAVHQQLALVGHLEAELVGHHLMAALLADHGWRVRSHGDDRNPFTTR